MACTRKRRRPAYIVVICISVCLVFYISVDRNSFQQWVESDKDMFSNSRVASTNQDSRECWPLTLASRSSDAGNVIVKPMKLPKILITPWSANTTYYFNVCSLSPDDYPSTLVHLVKSNYVNKQRRHAIRDTWGAIKIIRGFRVELVFILGLSDKRKENDEIRHESDLFGDILLLDAVDEPSLVTDKVLVGMRWVTSKFTPDTIYSSVDDDILIHTPHLLEHVTSFVSAGQQKNVTPCYRNLPIICTYSYQATDKPARKPNSKWFVSFEDYPDSVWPRYCRGGMYIAPVSMIGRLLQVASATRRLHLDDVWITGILRRKLGEGDTNIKAAPYSERSEADLHFNEVHRDHVIVSHTWGNTEFQPDDVMKSMTERYKSWKVRLPPSGRCARGLPWLILKEG